MIDDRTRSILAKGRPAPAVVQHENEDGTRRPRSEILVDGILAKAEADDLIVAGAREDLHKLAGTLSGTPHEKAAQLVALLLTPGGKRYLNADRPADAAGAAGSLLARVVRLLPLRDERHERGILDAFALKANAASDLDAIVAAGRDLAEQDGKPFDEQAAVARAPITAARDVAAMLIEYLETAEGAESWDTSVRPKPTAHELRVRYYLQEFARLGFLSNDASIPALARRFSHVASVPTPAGLRELFRGIATVRGAAGPADRLGVDFEAWGDAIDAGATYNGPDVEPVPPPGPRNNPPRPPAYGPARPTGPRMSRDEMRAYLKATGTGGI